MIGISSIACNTLMAHLRIHITLLLLLSTHILCGQTLSHTIEQLLEFLTVHPNKKAVARDSSIYPAKAIITPVVAYAPETNLTLGVGIKGLFKMRGSGDETRTSNMPLTVQYSIENKYFFFSGFEIFSPQERYMLTGNIKIQSFPSRFYGVGQNTSKENEEQFDYSQVLIEPILLKNMFRKFLYLGGGIRYNRIANVEYEPGSVLQFTETPGARGSTSVGFQAALIYDSRDNILNASKGSFLSLTHGVYGDYLGSTQRYQLTRFDFRHFIQPLGKPTSILGFQFMTQFSTSDTPLLDLGRLGGDEMMRGYFEGRYTEKHLMALQVEWRQKLSYRWGLVAFGGLGNVAPTIDTFNKDTIRPSIGVGLRFLVDEAENLNIRFDYGVGNEKSNYYFQVAEAF